jgi:hypothetical protein
VAPVLALADVGAHDRHPFVDAQAADPLDQLVLGQVECE